MLNEVIELTLLSMMKFRFVLLYPYNRDKILIEVVRVELRFLNYKLILVFQKV